MMEAAFLFFALHFQLVTIPKWQLKISQGQLSMHILKMLSALL